MNDLYWREPLWLVAALYPLALWAWARWRQRRVRSGYADARLWPWVRVSGVTRPAGPLLERGARQRLLLAGAWVLLVAALAGPRMPQEVPERAQPPAGAVLAVLDLSRSMEARDMQGSRRAAARRVLQAWNAEPNRPPLGLVVYAGRAHRFFPPSPDPVAVGHFLEQLPGLQLPTLGNDLAGGLESATKALREVAGHHAVVLLSDGDLDAAARKRAEAAVTAWSGHDLSFTVLGVGSATATAVPNPAQGWLTVEGRPVVSRLEAPWLERLAAAGGGRYLTLAGAAGPTLSEVWRGPAPRIAPADRDRVLWRELYHWLLVPGIALLVAALLLPAGASVVALAGVGTALVGALAATPVRAADAQAAFAALEAGHHQQARTLYGQLAGYTGRFGEGVACFRLEDWACAGEALAAAAWLAEDDADRARAAYNLAATRYRQGDYAGAAVLYRDARAHGLELPGLGATIAFTETLAAQVEQRRREREGASARAGRGSRPVEGEMQDQVAADRELAIGPPRVGPLPRGLDRAQFDALVARGLDRARLAEASGGKGGPGASAWFGGEDVAAERPGTQLWQRLFEIEEGFPAPVTQRRPRAQERAW